MRHKHADLIIAWANGAIIEYRPHSEDVWKVKKCPLWDDNYGEYRVKPKDKVKVYKYAYKPAADGTVKVTTGHYETFDNDGDPCIRLDWTMKEIEEN